VQKFLQKDQLAREEHILYIPGAKISEIRAEQDLPPMALPTTDADFLQSRMHGICVGEIEAMEGAGRTVCDFEDVPWEFTLDMARQVWDESRHTEIYERLLRHVQSTLGEYPESRILWECACAEDPAARVAGVNRGLEGLACDVFAQLVQLAQKLGDPIIERAVDFVLADEITHVRMGSTWMRKLTEDDPARRQMALDFQHHIDELFNFGGARQDGPADQVAISISREARKLAGFTDEEIDRLVKAASASVAY
jgi:uncharacterized ferritin-like protein (DUF455 family)